MSPRPRLFTIAPDAPFLGTLADRLLNGTILPDWPRTGPFWLADITIVLPTRRARLALAEALMQRGQGLLPDIRTFGGEAADEEPFLPPHDLPNLPPSVSPLERRLSLARLIAAWADTPVGRQILATPPNAAEIIGLGESLGQLVDDIEIESTADNDIAAKLRTLPPGDLAANWQRMLEFLDIALTFWPQQLAGLGREDAAKLRNLRLRRQAATAPLIFGTRPVIAAGSTGSVPATADLLAAIAALPRGAVVLPGLDTSLTPDEHQALLDDAAAPHGHPQYGLARLLRHLGAGPGEVIELGGDTRAPRTLLLRRALALPDATATWSESRDDLAASIPAATSGLSIIAARTADLQARAIALAACDALGRRQTVGIVTPDQTLARRIAAELRRFGVGVDDPAGEPLFLSPAGRLARLALGVAANAFAPVELMAFLRNRAVTLGLERVEISRFADALDLRLLRGRRLRPGLPGLRAALADAKLPPELEAGLGQLFDSLETTFQPLCRLYEQTLIRPGDLAIALTTIIGTDPALPGQREFARWVDALQAHPDDAPRFPPRGLENVLSALMTGLSVTNAERRRDDIYIWGTLEARLQNPDLMILAGLNEDIWPDAADPGPWLSRGMRIKAGLEPPERRHGQAAHDFEMAIGNARAILAFSARLGTAPATPSRFLQRLEAFLGNDIALELRLRGQLWLDAAAAIDAATELRPAPRPLPKPPLDLRPRQLSITEIETLVRSPYDLYAKHVLGLRRLAALGEDVDARERGTIIHDIFARFVEEGHDVMASDALDTLKALAADAFSGLEAIGERRDIWLRRFNRAAEGFLVFERAREPEVARRHAEIKGTWTLPSFTLTGRADRIDELRDGRLEIIDYKTGSPPDRADMENYLAPQLLLEAAMAGQGAFSAIAAAPTGALTYVKIGLGPEAFDKKPFRLRDGLDMMAAADEAARRMQAHVDALLLRDDQPMGARILPAPNRRYAGDYDHLSRAAEWSLSEGDDSE